MKPTKPSNETLAKVLLDAIIKRKDYLRRKPKLSKAELIELKALNKQPIERILSQ